MLPPNPLCFSSSPRTITGVIPRSVPTALISWNRNECQWQGAASKCSCSGVNNINKKVEFYLHPRSDLYSSHCTVCPQSELPFALREQRWWDTEEKKSLKLWQTAVNINHNGSKIYYFYAASYWSWKIMLKKKKMSKQRAKPNQPKRTRKYLKFCYIQRTALLPNNQKLYSDMFLLCPAWRRGAARELGEGPGDGTGGRKHIWTLTHHLRRTETLISVTWLHKLSLYWVTQI